MTEDERELDLDTLPPFPWRQEGRIIFDAEDHVVIGETCGAPTETVAATITDCMNSLATDGWLEPVSEFTETLYNDLAEMTAAFTRANERNRAAIEQIERYRRSGMVSTYNLAGLKLESTTEILDTLHDVLSGGGSMTYTPCRYAVIPDVGEDGMCVAHATVELDGERYCRPHAKALEERQGAL